MQPGVAAGFLKTPWLSKTSSVTVLMSLSPTKAGPRKWAGFFHRRFRSDDWKLIYPEARFLSLQKSRLQRLFLLWLWPWLSFATLDDFALVKTQLNPMRCYENI